MKYLLHVTKPNPEQQHSEQLNIPPSFPAVVPEQQVPLQGRAQCCSWFLVSAGLSGQKAEVLPLGIACSPQLK